MDRSRPHPSPPGPQGRGAGRPVHRFPRALRRAPAGVARPLRFCGTSLVPRPRRTLRRIQPLRFASARRGRLPLASRRPQRRPHRLALHRNRHHRSRRKTRVQRRHRPPHRPHAAGRRRRVHLGSRRLHRLRWLSSLGRRRQRPVPHHARRLAPPRRSRAAAGRHCA